MRLSDLYQEEDQAQEEPNYLQRSQPGFVTPTVPTYSVGAQPDNGAPRQSFPLQTGPPAPPVAPVTSPLDLYVPQADEMKMQQLQAGLAEARDQLHSAEITPEQYGQLEQQIIPNLTALAARKQKAQALQQEQAAQQAMSAHAMVNMMETQAAKAQTASIPERLFHYFDPMSERSMLLSLDKGKIERVDEDPEPLANENTLAGEAPLSLAQAAVGAAAGAEPEKPPGPYPTPAREPKPWSPKNDFPETVAQKAVRMAAEGMSKHPDGPTRVSPEVYKQAHEDATAQERGYPRDESLTEAEVNSIRWQAHRQAGGNARMEQHLTDQMLTFKRHQKEANLREAGRQEMAKRQEQRDIQKAVLAEEKGPSKAEILAQTYKEYQTLTKQYQDELKKVAKELLPDEKKALQEAIPEWMKTTTGRMKQAKETISALHDTGEKEKPKQEPAAPSQKQAVIGDAVTDLMKRAEQRRRPPGAAPAAPVAAPAPAGPAPAPLGPSQRGIPANPFEGLPQQTAPVPPQREPEPEKPKKKSFWEWFTSQTSPTEQR